MSIQNALFTLSAKSVNKLRHGLTQPRRYINGSFLISYK